jgi:hypothetical protein
LSLAAAYAEVLLEIRVPTSEASQRVHLDDHGLSDVQFGILHIIAIVIVTVVVDVTT